MKYRPQRGALADAMAEVVDLPDRAALVAHLASDFARWGIHLSDSDVRMTPYCFDDRIGWDTHLVTLRNKIGDRLVFGEHMEPDYFGAVGYTDSSA